MFVSQFLIATVEKKKTREVIKIMFAESFPYLSRVKTGNTKKRQRNVGYMNTKLSPLFFNVYKKR